MLTITTTACIFTTSTEEIKMNQELNYRIKFTVIEPDILGRMCDKEYSTKWMTYQEALEHDAMNEDNAKIIERD